MEVTMKIAIYFKRLFPALLVLLSFVGCSGKSGETGSKADVEGAETAPEVVTADKNATEGKGAAVVAKPQNPKDMVLFELRQNLEAADPLKIAHAIMALQHFGAQDAIPEIKDFLRNKNLTVKRAAIHALAGFKHKDSLPDIYRLFVQEDNDEVRKAVLLAFQDLNDDSTPSFIERVLPRLSPYLAAVALRVLEKIQPPREFVSETGRESLESFTISGSIGLGDNAKIQIGREFFAVGEMVLGYKIQRINVTEKLVSLEKDGKIFSKPIDDAEQDEVEKAVLDLNSDDDEKVYAALMRLAVLRSPQASEELIGILNGRNSDDIKLAAINVLGQSGIEKAEPALRNIIARVRRADYIISAVKALTEIGASNMHTVLEPLAQHADPWVRNAAVSAIGDLQLDSCLPTLVQKMDDSHSFVRNNAAYQLILFSHDGARNMIVSFLNSSLGRSSAPEVAERKRELITYLSGLDVEDNYSGGTVYSTVDVPVLPVETAGGGRYAPNFYLLDMGNFGGRNLITISDSPDGERIRRYSGDELDGGKVGEIDPEDESFELFLPDGNIALISKGAALGDKAVLLDMYKE
jgi:HEAT repeat protein